MYVSSVTTTQGKRQNSHSRATCSAILFEYPPPSRQSASHVLETEQCRRFVINTPYIRYLQLLVFVCVLTYSVYIILIYTILNSLYRQRLYNDRHSKIAADSRKDRSRTARRNQYKYLHVPDPSITRRDFGAFTFTHVTGTSRRF